jgi:hypothetical protein
MKREVFFAALPHGGALVEFALLDQQGRDLACGLVDVLDQGRGISREAFTQWLDALVCDKRVIVFNAGNSGVWLERSLNTVWVDAREAYLQHESSMVSPCIHYAAAHALHRWRGEGGTARGIARATQTIWRYATSALYRRRCQEECARRDQLDRLVSVIDIGRPQSRANDAGIKKPLHLVPHRHTGAVFESEKLRPIQR